jgi:hypothetical protein
MSEGCFDIEAVAGVIWLSIRGLIIYPSQIDRSSFIPLIGLQALGAPQPLYQTLSVHVFVIIQFGGFIRFFQLVFSLPCAGIFPHPCDDKSDSMLQPIFYLSDLDTISDFPFSANLNLN